MNGTYAVYDLFDNELCVAIGSAVAIADFLGITIENVYKIAWKQSKYKYRYLIKKVKDEKYS